MTQGRKEGVDFGREHRDQQMHNMAKVISAQEMRSVAWGAELQIFNVDQTRIFRKKLILLMVRYIHFIYPREAQTLLLCGARR